MPESDRKGKKEGSGPKRPGRPTTTAREASPPVLTEKQRREAREARMRRRKAARSRTSKSNPLLTGIRATGRELGRAFAFLGSLLLAGLDALSSVGRLLAGLVERLARMIERLLGLLAGLISAAGQALGRAVGWADGVLTPSRAVILVAVASALMLGWSQFIDYRAVEIGQPGYAGVLDLATPPTTDGRTPIDQHSVLLVAAAIVALTGAVLAAGGRRPVAALPVTAVGLLTVAITLLVDLPAGTDASEVEAAYSGAEAVLLAGFWLQLAAGLGLVCCGLLIATAPRPSPAGRRVRSRRGRRPLEARGAG